MEQLTETPRDWTQNITNPSKTRTRREKGGNIPALASLTPRKIQKIQTCRCRRSKVNSEDEIGSNSDLKKHQNSLNYVWIDSDGKCFSHFPEKVEFISESADYQSKCFTFRFIFQTSFLTRMEDCWTTERRGWADASLTKEGLLKVSFLL